MRAASWGYLYAQHTWPLLSRRFSCGVIPNVSFEYRNTLYSIDCCITSRGSSMSAARRKSTRIAVQHSMMYDVWHYRDVYCQSKVGTLRLQTSLIATSAVIHAPSAQQGYHKVRTWRLNMGSIMSPKKEQYLAMRLSNSQVVFASRLLFPPMSNMQ